MKSKTLKFVPELVSMILSGEKYSTWRLYDEKALAIGDQLRLIDSSTNQEFAQAIVTGLRQKVLGAITEADFVGNGRFESPEVMLATFQKYYGDQVSHDTVVKMVDFKLVGDQAATNSTEEWPAIINEVGFDFSWDERKVWQLDVPTTEMPVKELEWHFNIPFLWEDSGVYNLKPIAVIQSPEQHQAECQRTMRADMSHPIDIMENKGRYLILDGLHRLMKARILGETIVKVRIISRELIPTILKE